MINVNFKKLAPDAKMPHRGSEYAAGYDLFANIKEPVTIQPGTCEKISTGIAIELPENTFGAIYPRSGLSTKRGLRCANSVGCVDADYRGIVIVALYNDSSEPQTIYNEDRIAQLVVQPFVSINFIEVDELSDTVRGTGGFGSTGVGVN